MIDGQWRPSNSAERITVVNPATEQVIGEVPDADSREVGQAVLGAQRAFEEGTWRALDADKRAEILTRSLQLLHTRIDAIAELVTSEMGLPISLSRAQTPAAIPTGQYFVDIARSEPVAEVRDTQLGAVAVVNEPVGVVAAIAPWNGPFNMGIAKIYPALAAGCSVVYKPAPETPLDAFFVAEALHDAGVPAGAFNLITGGAETGRALVAHPAVDKVSFTGSTAAGREIGRECGGNFKRMQLELGGKSAAIVLDDADLSTTMQGLAVGCFFNAGQICAAYSRVLVPRTRHDEFVDALVATAESFVVGDPFDPATTMGPLVSDRHRRKVLSYIELGRSEGATVATGGGIPPSLPIGYFVQPTVFVGATNRMRISQEEIFGPVVAVIAYDDIDEAVAMANDSDYGLHGAVFTNDAARAADIARRVRTGTFSVNKFVYNTEAPFGGVKSSGVGRDTGPEAVRSYFELKTINLIDSMTSMFS
ncbi:MULTISPECIES: aldehyde dehydrogenase [unclassified Mycolicibacterium]|uniref:aldehyde dehydrogenase n=1 Tax=unclassified Mycolicibacterium TaxID=2636767 RepID=UPI001EE46F4F|nr:MULTISPECIES: aldehyde dehydrogenase [unclassified Mycolicibacterium]